VNELSSANDNLRAQLLEKERAVSVLQMTVSSLESRLSLTVGQEAVDRTGTQPVLVAAASKSAADQGDDIVGEVYRRFAHQLIADSEELDVLGQTIDQVNISLPVLIISLFSVN